MQDHRTLNRTTELMLRTEPAYIPDVKGERRRHEGALRILHIPVADLWERFLAPWLGL